LPFSLDSNDDSLEGEKLKMLGTHHIAHDSKKYSNAYASSADFCRIFESDMNRLYLLAFLLTSDHALAEKCFVQGLEDSKKGNLVFKEWAQSWARRSVITNTIRLIHPRPELALHADSLTDSMREGRSAQELGALPNADVESTAPSQTFSKEIGAIIDLPAFQRFAFVISVLEGYSNREASLLLDCSVHELVSARSHALQRIGGRPELHRKLAGIDATEASLANAGSAYVKEVMAHLASPA
jgi:DNA-directed RNA polymerase specialized sigma24 family protein